jgi:hypothetical protein
VAGARRLRGMASGIDHIVIAMPDPEAAAAEITERVGLAFTAGGRHPGLGTFNRIAFLGDAYLELIGVDDRGEAEGWGIGAAAVRALDRGGGFATWALTDETIRTTVARLQANGSRIGPVTHGSRERQDGERVEWWTATPPELGPDRPPLLIKHLAAGAEWGAEGLAARRAFVHPVGGPVGLLGIELAVPDPVELATACLAEVGVEFQAVGSAAVATVGRHAIRLTHGTSGMVEATVTLGLGGAGRSSRPVRVVGMNLIMLAAAAV